MEGTLLTRLLPLAVSATFLNQRMPTYRIMAPPIVAWALLYQLIIRKMPHRHTHRLIWQRQFLNWRSFYLSDSRFMSSWQTKPNQPLSGEMAQWENTCSCREQVPFLIPTCLLTTNCNSGPKESDAIFWPLQAPGMHGMHIHNTWAKYPHIYKEIWKLNTKKKKH